MQMVFHRRRRRRQQRCCYCCMSFHSNFGLSPLASATPHWSLTYEAPKILIDSRHLARTSKSNKIRYSALRVCNVVTSLKHNGFISRRPFEKTTKNGIDGNPRRWWQILFAYLRQDLGVYSRAPCSALCFRERKNGVTSKWTVHIFWINNYIASRASSPV